MLQTKNELRPKFSAFHLKSFIPFWCMRDYISFGNYDSHQFWNLLLFRKIMKSHALLLCLGAHVHSFLLSVHVIVVKGCIETVWQFGPWKLFKNFELTNSCFSIYSMFPILQCGASVLMTFLIFTFYFLLNLQYPGFFKVWYLWSYNWEDYGYDLEKFATRW